MAYYIRLSDNFYPLTERDIREAHPNTSFATPFNPEGYAVVFPVPQPAYDQYAQRVQEAAPVLTDKGHYEQVWLVVDLTGEELEEAQARKVADEAKADEQRKAALWQAATDYEQSFIANMAIGLLTMGVMQQKPKCQAVAAWSYALWNGPDGYYARKASGSTDTDFSSIGPMPYSVPELSAEVYGE